MCLNIPREHQLHCIRFRREFTRLRPQVRVCGLEDARRHREWMLQMAVRRLDSGACLSESGDQDAKPLRTRSELGCWRSQSFRQSPPASWVRPARSQVRDIRAVNMCPCSSPAFRTESDSESDRSGPLVSTLEPGSDLAQQTVESRLKRISSDLQHLQV